MARTFEMQDCRRLREVKGLEAAEPGAWAAFPWAQLFTGCLLLSGLWGDVVYHKALPRGLGASWGLRGLGEDGRQPARESAWRERKQVAEASPSHTGPAPCLATFLREGWPVPLDSYRGMRVTEGSSELPG